MHLRRYSEGDIDAVAALFYDTVHAVCAKDYDAGQLDAWVNGRPDKAAWNASLLAHHTVVAERGGVIVGFGDIAGDYLDRLYVHRDHQGQGAATAILSALERHARDHGERRIVTLASITARPFFERRGYKTVREQRVERGGVVLANFVMEKALDRPPGP
jgi:putative acetyltransferase